MGFVSPQQESLSNLRFKWNVYKLKRFKRQREAWLERKKQELKDSLSSCSSGSSTSASTTTSSSSDSSSCCSSTSSSSSTGSRHRSLQLLLEDQDDSASSSSSHSSPPPTQPQHASLAITNIHRIKQRQQKREEWLARKKQELKENLERLEEQERQRQRQQQQHTYNIQMMTTLPQDELSPFERDALEESRSFVSNTTSQPVESGVANEEATPYERDVMNFEESVVSAIGSALQQTNSSIKENASKKHNRQYKHKKDGKPTNHDKAVPHIVSGPLSEEEEEEDPSLVDYPSSSKWKDRSVSSQNRRRRPRSTSRRRRRPNGTKSVASSVTSSKQTKKRGHRKRFPTRGGGYAPLESELRERYAKLREQHPTPPHSDLDDDDDDDEMEEYSLPASPQQGFARRLLGMAGCLQDAEDLMETYKTCVSFGTYEPPPMMDNSILVPDGESSEDDEEFVRDGNLLRKSQRTRALEKCRTKSPVPRNDEEEEEDASSYDGGSEEDASTIASKHQEDTTHQVSTTSQDQQGPPPSEMPQVRPNFVVAGDEATTTNKSTPASWCGMPTFCTPPPPQPTYTPPEMLVQPSLGGTALEVVLDPRETSSEEKDKEDTRPLQETQDEEEAPLPATDVPHQTTPSNSFAENQEDFYSRTPTTSADIESLVVTPPARESIAVLPSRRAVEELPPRFRKFHADDDDDEPKDASTETAEPKSRENMDKNEPSIFMPVFEAKTSIHRKPPQPEEPLRHYSSRVDEAKHHPTNAVRRTAALFIPSCAGDEKTEDEDREVLNTAAVLPGYRKEIQIPQVVKAVAGGDASVLSYNTFEWHNPNHHTSAPTSSKPYHRKDNTPQAGGEDDEYDEECSYGELRHQLVIVIDPQHTGCPRIRLANETRLNQQDESTEALKEALDLARVKQSALVASQGLARSSSSRASFHQVALQRETKRVVDDFQEEKKQDSFFIDDHEEEEELHIRRQGAEAVEPHCSVEVILAEEELQQRQLVEI